MRVAMVSTYPPIHCGVGEYTRFLLTAMAGVHPAGEYFVLAEEGVGGEYFDYDARARVVPAFRRMEPRSYDGILEALESVGGVDVLHVQHEYGIYSGNPRLLKVLGEARESGLARAVVVTLHSVHHPHSPDEGKWGALAFQRSLPDYVDSLVVHSAVQEFELQSEGLPFPVIHRIPHGTFVNPHVSEPRIRLAERLGVDPGRLEGPVIALAGFLHKRKGLDTLVEALDYMRRRLTLIIGGEIKEDDVRDYIREAGAGRVVLLDRYLSGDEILSIAALADAIVMPYKDIRGLYAVSGILHLSMGSLKPIVGTRMPKLVELYTLAPQLTVPPDDPRALAERLEWTLENYDVAVAYASQLYSYAVRTSWLRIARRHLSLYRELLRRGGPRGS